MGNYYHKLNATNKHNKQQQACITSVIYIIHIIWVNFLKAVNTEFSRKYNTAKNLKLHLPRVFAV